MKEIARGISMKHLQAADRVLGAVTFALLQPLRFWRLRPRREAPVERILVIKFWGMGSLQLLTPAIRALRTRYPDAHLSLLTLHQNEAFAAGLGIFDDIRTFRVSERGWLRMLVSILALVRSLRRGRFDAVYDFEFFTRFSAVISALSGAPLTCGFSSPSVWRGGVHTRSVLFNRYWHVARNFRCLVGGENGEDVSPGDLSVFRVSAENEAEVDEQLGAAHLGDTGPLIVLNPDAGSLSLERRWPQSSFADLARRLVRERGARVVLVGGPDEVAWTSEVKTQIGAVPERHVANLAGKLSIGGLQALLARADVFVGNDSGPMHLAAAQGTPTIGLFGPETPVMYSPIGEQARFLYKPPPCSPCINVHNNKFAVCRMSRAECLIGISSSEVYDEVMVFLEGGPLRVLTPQPQANAPGSASARSGDATRAPLSHTDEASA